MYPVPARAESLLGRSHGIAGRLLGSVNGSDFVLPIELQAGSGKVEVDSKSPARRKLSATVHAAVDDGRLDPLAAEVRAEYAIVDPTSGERWWTPVGTFVVTDAAEEAPGIVKLSGVDRWQRVVEARFERAVTTSGDTVAAITALLLDADGRITVDASRAPAGYTHRARVWERDRDKAIVELAKSIGCTVYFDPLGVARIEPIVPLGADPVWRVNPGVGGVKIGSSVGISRAQTYNAVSVTGEPGDNLPPVYAVARDTDPASATRWGGRFGKRPRFFTSNLVRTTAQAQAVADALLDRVRGVARTVVVDAVQHPGLDAHDPIVVHTGPGRYEAHRVGSFALTLGLGTTSITAQTGADEDDGGQ